MMKYKESDVVLLKTYQMLLNNGKYDNTNCYDSWIRVCGTWQTIIQTLDYGYRISNSREVWFEDEIDEVGTLKGKLEMLNES